MGQRQELRETGALRPALALPSALALPAPASPRNPARSRGTAHRRKAPGSAAGAPCCSAQEKRAPLHERRSKFTCSGAERLPPRLPAGPEDRPPPARRSLRSRAQGGVGQRGGWGVLEERAGLVTRAPQGLRVASGAKGGDLRQEPRLSLSCAPTQASQPL